MVCAVAHFVDADGATRAVEFWSEYSIDLVLCLVRRATFA